VVGRVSGQTTIQVSRRVEGAGGTFLGVIVFSLAPGQLTTLHRSIDLGPGGRLAVIGSTDSIIRARFGTGDQTGDFGAGERVPPLPPATRDSTGDDATVQTFVRQSVVDHADRLYSMRGVPGYPLRVAVGFDLTAVLAPAEAHARLIETAGVIATLMLAGLMTLLILEIRRRTDREVKLRDEQTRLAREIQLGSQIQQRLRSSEARLRDFAEMASDWFWEMDADLRFIETSIEGPSLSDAHRSHFGKHAWEVFDVSQMPGQWEDHRRTLLARLPFRDFRHARPDAGGRLRHVSINGVPVFGEGDAFLGYRGTGRDVTATVEAEAELRRAKEEAEASSIAKSAFLANMSHELRTPLNAIIGFAELIHARKTGSVTADYVEWAGDILSSGRHLLELINDVLELSRIEAGHYELVDATIDLGVAVRACLPMIRGQAEKNRVRIDYAIPEKSALVRADRRAIKQVMLNLLTNAVKFTPSGGMVSIRAERTDAGELAVIVADTGIGIDPAALPRLCQPFVQADASTSRRYGGSGLGLAISNRLVALHGGTLTIASALGQGTKVCVNFPASRVVTIARQEVVAE
jgi:signal transduction histidine kinase